MKEKAMTIKGMEIPISKIKAAYALNTCTVSVSQIIDYNDVYILEQEYDAILNNLNLEEMPKDEALLKTLVEILNTISFFRIQEIRKKQIEKKYKQTMKNAIWSAIPNLNVIVANNPITAVLSLATTVGTGYMNYRKEKAAAIVKKEDDEIELQISAIEQLNSLRRELFSSAWRMAKDHAFPDCLRLTENQIKQYNAILMDADDQRKYARMEAIRDNFYAYPPFWYFYAHTAMNIAMATKDNGLKGTFLKKAREHFETFDKLSDIDIFRENQIAASANLEHVDLLLTEEKTDCDLALRLIKKAEEKSGNTLDVLQLCAMDYLRIGKIDEAARVMKILVNEDYNAISNAKILSSIYAAQYAGEIEETKKEADANYQLLSSQINPQYLYPLLGSGQENKAGDYMSTQKTILIKKYRNTMNAFAAKMKLTFNEVLPAPSQIDEIRDFYGISQEAVKNRESLVQKAFEGAHANSYRAALKDCNYQQEYLRVLNDTVFAVDSLQCFRRLTTYETLVHLIESKLRLAKRELNALQDKLDKGDFDYKDYCDLNKYSFDYFTGDFFEKVKDALCEPIRDVKDLSELDELERELNEFCENNSLPSPEEYLSMTDSDVPNKKSAERKVFFDGFLLGLNGDSVESETAQRDKMLQTFEQYADDICQDADKVHFYRYNENHFKTYFDNTELKYSDCNKYSIMRKTLVVIEDSYKKRQDLLLCTDGVRLVKKNKVLSNVNYSSIKFSSYGSNRELKLGELATYDNEAMKVENLYELIQALEGN